VGVKETKPRRPPAAKVALPALPDGATRGATRTIIEKLDGYADHVASYLLHLIAADTTPADVKLEAIKEYYDRTVGPKPKVVLQHTTGNAGGPAPSPRRFEFVRSLPVPQDIQDVQVLSALPNT